MKLAFNLDKTMHCCLCDWHYTSKKLEDAIKDLEAELVVHLNYIHNRSPRMIDRRECKSVDSSKKYEYHGMRWNNEL